MPMPEYTLDVDRSANASAHAEEQIIEFERKMPFEGFQASHLFPNEPNFRYGDGNGLALASKEDLVLPDSWKWADEWHVLKGSSVNQSGTDSDGWMYAFNWGVAYAGSFSMTHCVRRRIWSRHRTWSDREPVPYNLTVQPAARKASEQIAAETHDSIRAANARAEKELEKIRAEQDYLRRRQNELSVVDTADFAAG